MKIFIDTWGWISLLNKREYHHEEVKKYYTEMRKKGREFFTTNDKPYLSFTDITSIVIINEFAISDVLTEDDHFMQVGIGIQKVP